MGRPLTSKNIRPVVAGVGYAQNYTPQAVEFAQMDAELATFGLDATAADTITGTLSLQNTGTSTPNVTLEGAAAVATGGGGGIIGTVLGSRGRLVLGAGDVPTYSTPRVRTVRMSLLETARVDGLYYNTGVDNGVVVDSLSGGITVVAGVGALNIGANNRFHIPISKPHNGATLTTVRVYFFLRAVPVTLPTLPFLLVWRESPAGVINAFSSGDRFTAASSVAYYNNGGVNVLTGTGFTNNVIDLSSYAYTIELLDDSNVVAVPNAKPIYTAIELDYTAIGDARWQQ
jgi:hypothetical protein